MKTAKIATSLALILLCFTAFGQTDTPPGLNKSPMPSIAGKTGGKISKQEFLADTVLHIIEGTALTKNQWQVIAFKISFTGKDVIYTEFQSTSATMPQAARTFVKNAPPGTKFFIEYVKAQMLNSSDNSEQHIPSTTFILVE